ncbi:hypothetical protein Ade02nite_34350 [Paractinoplanes deccanensis]|uniref:DUF305 domain-containing protein n=1 Tax=Paractinoplanes deccanensis TaxID=113561 RepID=A0ABQ3Y476_9ACTN|nr:DUF305 domain-containing protein [Actinoplanes deccanensis]GID74794.1 hypothetical protein Ade02nite_34350 [Actinoplanes deccanensis]
MSRSRVSMLLALLVLVAVVVSAVVAARSGPGGSAAAPRADESAAPPVRVVVPGLPGESSTVTDSRQVRAPDGSTYNAADVAFVQMMIVHHGQAVEMAALVPGRGQNSQLLALARRMQAVQEPEIGWLRTWLSQRKLPDSDPSHDHSTMPGMQSGADMQALAAAKGPEFDRRFIAMMTDHHRGAMRMAGEVLKSGEDERLRETAGEMAVEQGSEIRRMQDL